MRATAAVTAALLLVLSATAVAGSPTRVLDPEAEPTGAPPAPPSADPILDALALLPPGIDEFEFTDWEALRQLHDGSAITSSSPLEERQRVMLDITRSETTRSALGLDRLATWPESWGWDTTDLAWQASCCRAPDFTILRFREEWDPAPFMARLKEFGYLRSDEPHAISFTVGPETDVPAEALLERVFDFYDLTAGIPPEPRASVAISPDGHTVVLVRGPDAHRILEGAEGIDPAAVRKSAFGRVAEALDRPLAATIFKNQDGCPWAPRGSREVTDEMVALARSAGPLGQYQALGIGYERAGPGEPAVGRYVFAYGKAKQAKADLPGRRTLIDEGGPVLHGAPYRDRAFTLIDANTVGSELVLDVALVEGTPRTFFDLVTARALSFARCD